MKTKKYNHQFIKELISSFYEFTSVAQAGVGEIQKDNFDFEQIDLYLQQFHSFDTYVYFISNSSKFRITQIGGAFEQMTGYKESDLLGKSYSQMFRFNRIKDVIRSVKGGVKYFQYFYSQPPQNRPFIKVNRTFDIRLKDGSFLYVLAQSIPIHFNDKMQPLYFLNIINDISALESKKEYTHYILDTSDSSNIKKIVLHKDDQMVVHKMSISKSELKVLQLVESGFTSKQIADKLNISEHTVKNHRKSLLQKAECSTSSELIKRAYSEGWLT